ncbi:MAG: DinB family protein [Cytophagales bacterium]|nr:DinB family protein [Cytophagales bacterium]
MKYYKRFEPIGKYWLEQLSCYNEAPFQKKLMEKRGTSWSIGQLYEHLTTTTLEKQLKAVNDCIEQQNGDTKGYKSFWGLLTFSFGKYLPFRQKLDEHHQVKPVQPKEIMDVRNASIKVLKEMNEYSQKIEKLSKEDLKYKVKHPKFGMLNAKEWYTLVSMHYQHHLKQKYKIDNMLMQH